MLPGRKVSRIILSRSQVRSSVTDILIFGVRLLWYSSIVSKVVLSVNGDMACRRVYVEYGPWGGGGYLEWFGVKRGLRQGCALSPLPCPKFFAAVITVALQRVGGDADTVADLVHLDEGVPQEVGVTTEEASAKVVRVQ